MGWDLDCMLGGGEAWISVFELFQWSMLHYKVKCCHDAKQLHCQHSSVFTVNSRFQLPFKHRTIQCRFTVVYQCIVTSPVAIHCRVLHECFHMCPFVLICKLLWHPPCTNFVIPEVVGCADPQVMSNLLAISLAVICMTSWTRALTHSTLSTIHEVVTQPEWSSPTMIEHFHTFIHLPLHNKVFSILCKHSSVNLGGYSPLPTTKNK